MILLLILNVFTIMTSFKEISRLYILLILLNSFLIFWINKSDPGYVGDPIVICKTNGSLLGFKKALQAVKKQDSHFRLPSVVDSYCSICRVFKTSGTYHCNQLGRCIADFDHYCLFLGNAIGKKNYFLFVLLLLTLSIQSTYAVVLYSKFTNCIDYIAFSVAVLSSLLVYGLLIFHFYLLLTKTSTLELIKNQKII